MPVSLLEADSHFDNVQLVLRQRVARDEVAQARVYCVIGVHEAS